jgi:hypothetical protein
MKDIVLLGHGVLRVVEPTLDIGLFRRLDDAEERQFIAWAKAQPDGVKVSPLWHPVVQNELLLSGRGVE